MENLNDVLSKSPSARQFFLMLPEDAQGALIQNANTIHSEGELRALAQQRYFEQR